MSIFDAKTSVGVIGRQRTGLHKVNLCANSQRLMAVSLLSSLVFFIRELLVGLAASRRVVLGGIVRVREETGTDVLVRGFRKATRRDFVRIRCRGGRVYL